MRILIDICHPAHVHFFRRPMELLKRRGHEVLVTSRAKEMTTGLLDDLGIAHRVISAQPDSAAGLFAELILRDYRLWRTVRRHKPDVMAAIGGTFVSHVGFLTGTPALVFYDTENARLQNALTYPLATRIYVPKCYRGWAPKRRTTRYRGYHELSYLHPNHFSPDRAVAIANGLAPDRSTFLLRLVSWKASHDIGERGWSRDLIRHVIASLQPHGKVIISSESSLPDEFSEYKYAGDPGLIHDVVAYCHGYIGESATMASEAAVLGVPALYISKTGRGYTDELEGRYGLVRNLRSPQHAEVTAAINWMLNTERSKWLASRGRLLEECVDVASFAADAMEQRTRAAH